MLQHGCSEKWTARACQLKHAELNPEELDEAPEERSPGFEMEYGGALQQGGRQNGSYMQEAAMGAPGQQMMQGQQQQQQQQQQMQEFKGRDARRESREHSADVRTDARAVAADASQQLLMMPQRLAQQKQEQILLERGRKVELEGQQQQQQQWNGGQ